MKYSKLAALRAAFPYTVPIFAGFWFLAMAYGIQMITSGFSFWYPMVMRAVIYGGSLEFVAVSMLLSPFAPAQTFLMTLMIQARHLFYGISMLDKYKNLGPKKYYLIYAMCDETFSVNYSFANSERRANLPQLFKCSCSQTCCTVTGGTYHSVRRVTWRVRSN